MQEQLAAVQVVLSQPSAPIETARPFGEAVLDNSEGRRPRTLKTEEKAKRTETMDHFQKWKAIPPESNKDKQGRSTPKSELQGDLDITHTPSLASFLFTRFS